MKTIDIKGKPYVTVNERLKFFRENFPDFSLETEVIKFTEKQVITYEGKQFKKDADILLKAIIKDKEGRIIATGLSYEKEGSTFINQTSFVENAETSAWGRALGNMGIGIDASVASAEEVLNAISNQK